jgi:hypothetical protein
VALSTDSRHFAVGEIVGGYHYVKHAHRSHDTDGGGLDRDRNRSIRCQGRPRVTLNARGTILEFRPVDAAQRLLALSDGSKDAQ